MKRLLASYRDNRIKFVFTILLLGCLVSQLLITLYFNIFEADIHLGIDSSWEYLKVIIVGDNGGIYSTKLISDTTAPWISRSFIFALPLYMVTGNINISYAIANLIITLLTIYFMVSVMQIKGFELNTILIVLNMFACPYLLNYYSWHNDLGYFNCVLGMAAYYNLIVLYIFMAFRILVSQEFLKKEKIIIGFSYALSFLIGVGAGMSMLAMVFLPLLITRIVLGFIKNTKKAFLDKHSIYIYICTGFALLGQFVGLLVGMKYKSSLASWSTTENIWKNIGNMFGGFMRLFAAIPTDETVCAPTSKEGILFVFSIIIFTIVIVSVVYALVKVLGNLIKNHNLDDFKMSLLVIMASTFVEFSLLDTSYGAVFEDRYLIFAMMCALILVGYFIDSLDNTLLFKKVGVVVLFLSVVCIDLGSDYIYKSLTNEEYLMDQMVSLIDEADAGLVYAWGKDTSIYEHCLRVYDTKRVYKLIGDDNKVNRWGDYLYYDDSSAYQGATMLMTNGDISFIPSNIMEKYELVGTIHGVDFYYCKDNPIDTYKLEEK